MRSVYIIGSKGIPARYGGFETFVEQLTARQKSADIHYHVACTRENSAQSGITAACFEHNGASCFSVAVPNIGPAKAVLYDILALRQAIALAKQRQDQAPIFYVLACRIGPFIGYFRRKIHQIGGKLLVNPDGHEWLRAKWSLPVRRYWKYSERLMVKQADLLVCDSQTIEAYIQKDYAAYHPQTAYIAYGTDLEPSALTADSPAVRDWFAAKQVKENQYYLVVGRFVPENNYAAMLREFMAAQTAKDLVLITDVRENAFYEKLRAETGFDRDSRIKFVGTVYDQDLLKYIRENAYAYLHGHEVGGTNPSLLEALGSTRLNLLLDVGFNREVAEASAIYWNKDNLGEVITASEQLTEAAVAELAALSTKQVEDRFSWEAIVAAYEGLFLSL